MIHLASHPSLVAVAEIALRPRTHYYQCRAPHCDDYYTRGITWPSVLAFAIMLVIIIALSFVRPLRRRFGLGPDAAAPAPQPLASPRAFQPPAPAPQPPAQAPPSPAGSAPAPDAAYQDPEYLGPGDWDGGPLDPPEYRTPPG